MKYPLHTLIRPGQWLLIPWPGTTVPDSLRSTIAKSGKRHGRRYATRKTAEGLHVTYLGSRQPAEVSKCADENTPANLLNRAKIGAIQT